MAASTWALIGNAVAAVFGVPLAVVIAASAGALLAKHKAELPPWRSFGRALLWVLVGCIVAQGLAEIITWLRTTPGLPPPAPVSPGLLGLLALLVSCFGPRSLPLLIDMLPVVLRSLVGRVAPEVAQPPPPDPASLPKPDGGQDVPPR
jgi:hypothetical protein